MYNMKIKLIEKKLSGNNEVAYLIFEIEKKFDFKAGQFTMLNNGSLKRAYSIASSPSLLKKSQIWFYVKKASETGMSKYLTKDIKVGDELDMMGPLWHMFIKEKSKKKDYLLISAWSWLWPILSIYEDLVESWEYNNIYNLHQERFFENIVEDIFKKINSFQNNNVKNIFFLSKWEHKLCEKWYIQSKLDDVLWKIKDKTNLEVYMCWNPSIVDDLNEKLKWFWIENIYFEKY